MTNHRPPAHWPSIIQFTLALLAAITFFGLGLFALLGGFLEFADGATLRTIDALSFISSAALLTLGACCVPSAFHALARITGRSVRAWKLGNPAILLWLPPALLLFVLGLGWLVSNFPPVAWVLLPPLHILAIGLPLVWYLALGAYRLEPTSPQRKWGAFGTGMVLSLVPILLLELILAAIVFAIILLIASQQPGFKFDLSLLLVWARQTSNPDPAIFIPFAEKYLLNIPTLLLGGLYVAVIIPFIEETFKPIGFLFVNRRKLTPTDGFVLGMLSGAGFAFIESVLQAASGELWLGTVAGRIGAGLVHIANSGLVGWGLAVAFGERKWGRLGRNYLMAIIIHGAWNSLAIVMALGYTPGLVISGLEEFPWGWAANFSLAGLVILGVISLTALIRTNQKLRSPGAVTPGAAPRPGESREAPAALDSPEPEPAPGSEPTILSGRSFKEN